MSWSRAVAMVAIVGIGFLGACGFEPLHGQNSAASGDALAEVRIKVVEDRIGQILRNRLLQVMSPKGTVSEPRWRLEVNLSESIEKVLVKESSFGTRANLRLNASYKLSGSPSSGGDQLTRSGSSVSVASYNILPAENEYANVVSERDAREKAINLLAADIKRRVAFWLRQAAGDQE